MSFELVLSIVIALIFFVAAIIVFKSKGSSLISGYSSMPDDKKATFNLTRITHDTAALLFIMGLLMFLFPLSSLINSAFLFYLPLFLLLALPIAFSVFVNSSKRYRCENPQTRQVKKKSEDDSN